MAMLFGTLWPLLYLVLAPFSMAGDKAVKGDPCSKLDLCKAKASDQQRTCDCDDHCHLFGTCCMDALSQPLMLNNSPAMYHCHSRRIGRPVFAKRSCSASFRGHVARELSCLEAEDDMADVVALAPATSEHSFVTYWSADCGLCSEEKESDLKRWPVRVSCPKSSGKVDERYVMRRLTFNKGSSEWGLREDTGFVPCSIRYMEPDAGYSATTETPVPKRYCPGYLISTCPGNYTDADVIQRCSTYHGEREKKNSNEYYRNVHCALCNGLTPKDLECPGLDRYDSDDKRPGEWVDVQFEPGEWLERDGEERFMCSDGFSHDPFWKRCRRLATSSFYSSRITSLAAPGAVQVVWVVAFLVGMLLTAI